MAKHLLYFQQVVKYNICINEMGKIQIIQAGLTNLEVKFDEWQWEEEVTIFKLEHVGLGKIISLK